jgi:hypothetical protein
LKTAVLYAIRDEEKRSGSLSEKFKKELALEFDGFLQMVPTGQQFNLKFKI